MELLPLSDYNVLPILLNAGYYYSVLATTRPLSGRQRLLLVCPFQIMSLHITTENNDVFVDLFYKGLTDGPVFQPMRKSQAHCLSHRDLSGDPNCVYRRPTPRIYLRHQRWLRHCDLCLRL
ncbi:hypothetical protein CEXT_704021 [Caerostris extrusa]|uniref:Uncharacterized protein n=1 Tax=Caerostris extrusa TaxID=172846 RepID=A0AAV4VJV7_CAEEX|nr:hypothetical protein CEXT_704021 [Caerostris extrusa]